MAKIPGGLRHDDQIEIVITRGNQRRTIKGTGDVKINATSIRATTAEYHLYEVEVELYGTSSVEIIHDDPHFNESSRHGKLCSCQCVSCLDSDRSLCICKDCSH